MNGKKSKAMTNSNQPSSKGQTTIKVTPDMITSDMSVKVDVSKSEPLNPNEYRCENCLEVYEKDWSDDEAQAEYEANFPNAAKQGVPRAIVCDDCYKEMIAWKDPKEADRKYEANK